MNTSIFDWIGLVAENVWLYGGAFFLVLGILVFIHEWGHYFVARLCGVKVESFSIGFGREIFGFTDKKGTRWKFSLVPLGGYVKMFGDVDPASTRHESTVKDETTNEQRPLTSEERREAFFAKPVPQRAAIVFAGPAINFLFAISVLTLLYIFHGQPVTPPVAAAVIGDSAAAQAGFVPGDEVIAIDGITIRRFEDIRREVAVGLDTRRVFTVRRDGQVIDISAAPEKLEDEDHFGFVHSRGMLGLLSPGNAIEIERVVSVDNQPVADIDEARSLLLSKMGTTIRLGLDRGPETDTILIRPVASANEALKNPDSEDYNHLVLYEGETEILVKHGPFGALQAAAGETYSITASTLVALGQMVVGTRSANELGGIIRIGALAGDMAKSGLLALIMFTALLSINLGLINLFPIPMLDGGHLVFYAVEAVKGSPISEQIQEYAFRFGLAILVGIMLFANLNDIVQLIL